MKLICEVNEELNIITEANERGGKSYFIEGVSDMRTKSSPGTASKVSSRSLPNKIVYGFRISNLGIPKLTIYNVWNKRKSGLTSHSLVVFVSR